MYSDEQIEHVSTDGWRVLLALFHTVDARAEDIDPDRNDPGAIQELKSNIESAALCVEALVDR